MGFGLIVIGDEILSGKRQDKHFSKVVELLAERGLRLSWAEFAGDDPVRLTELFRRSFAGDDIVFSCGGIGATPDDHTRQSAAAALGLPLALHPEGKRLIEARIRATAEEAGRAPDFEAPDNLQRLRMAEFPQGATLIPNPYNGIAGFTVAARAQAPHHFVPGFPVMAWPMLAWVLDQHYAELFHRDAQAERSLLVFEQAEAALTPLMEALQRDHPGIRVFSLPSVGDAHTRRHIELGVKGDAASVGPAWADLCAALDRRGAEYRPLQEDMPAN